MLSWDVMFCYIKGMDDLIHVCVSLVERYLMSGITISRKWRLYAKNAKRCK